MSDFLFRGELAEIDPDLSKLASLEAERQYHKLILIASESSSPISVREALSTAFHNIYAEGYPPEKTRWMQEEKILDFKNRLAEYRRYSDPRYYKGVEYADIVEALARRRCAEAFAVNGLTADDLFVNVQALSGAPANNAVYHALVSHGDAVMGLSLLHGGHLSHGSPVNRSGKYHEIVSYSVNPETERLDYDQIERLAIMHKPKMIIAGISSYPWMLDWARFREIADKVGAYLFADIAHVAGLVAARVYDSPVGFADVITFTTHKSLCGPRGAVILTANPTIARKIDRAVFPGEQGGPHVNVFAAMAVAFKLSQTKQFRDLQAQVIDNCAVFTKRFEERGFKIAYNGTNTHLMNLDMKSVTGEEGAFLTGDLASRIMDIAGVVANRNTIPGDKSAFRPTGVRMGTHWITQRGFKEPESIKLADLIADLLLATIPYYQGSEIRAKVDFKSLERIKVEIRQLAHNAGVDFNPTKDGYPHFFYMDDDFPGKDVALEIGGNHVKEFLNVVVSSDLDSLSIGQYQPTTLSVDGTKIPGTISCLDNDIYQLSVRKTHLGVVAAWLRDLSDGFIKFDDDLVRKVPGPVWIMESQQKAVQAMDGEQVDKKKPYYIGMASDSGDALPTFVWQQEDSGLKQTPIYGTHLKLGGKMVSFGGWEMPVRYASVMEEHLAVREKAGVFDVTHMGVYQAEGSDAVVFLDSVCGNDISALEVGESLYTHFLDPEANVIDDLLVYRRGAEKYLIVVNAANDDKDWLWLNAVRMGTVCVDIKRPWARVFGRNVRLRNLRDPKEGIDMRVDIALQGPLSREILLALGTDAENKKKVFKLNRTQLCEATVGKYNLIVSRTGYTGESMAFELFVHPKEAESLFNDLLYVGKSFGLKPIGLGARDSLRIEAGLPLYGHEMGGAKNLGVAEAGFGSYVKTYKPWFIGRSAFIAREKNRNSIVMRFRFNEKGVRMAHQGDPIVDKRGKVIGAVTSCSADREGYLLGQAIVDMKFAEEGTPIFVFKSAPDEVSKAPANLIPGDRVSIPTTATILRRFPE